MFETEFIVTSVVHPVKEGPMEVELQAERCMQQSCPDFPSPIAIGGKISLLLPNVEAAAKFELGKSVSVHLKITF